MPCWLLGLPSSVGLSYRGSCKVFPGMGQIFELAILIDLAEKALHATLGKDSIRVSIWAGKGLEYN